MFEKKQIEAIVPAYNEGLTIADIVEEIATHPRIARVIVVDDGSSDETSENIQKLIRDKKLDQKILLLIQKNQGKTKAVENGFRKTSAPYILMLDSDLIGLNHEHISTLTDPVLSGEADMTIGLFKFGRFITDLAHRTNPNLSGQRCMKRECLEKVDWQKIKNFGLESHLTDLIKIYNWKMKWVDLCGMTHRMKTEKRGFWQGWKTRFEMWWQIIYFDWFRETGWNKIFKRKK